MERRASKEIDMRIPHLALAGLALSFLLALGASTGCESTREAPADTFVSDIPRELQDRAPSYPGDGDGDVPGEGDDPLRPIAEADIVQLASGKLYALSRYGGLQVFDTSAAMRARTTLGSKPASCWRSISATHITSPSWARSPCPAPSAIHGSSAISFT
jgi:hypothetical protein